jgi:OmpA-OmpF porin, OOP family
MRGLAAACCAFGAALLVQGAVPGAAAAQRGGGQLAAGGMDLRLYRPPIDSKGYLSLNGSDVLPHKRYSFGLIMDAGFGLLRFDGFEDRPDDLADDARLTERIVDQYFTGVLHFNFGLFNRLVVGMQLPVHVVNGPAIEVPGYYNDNNVSQQGFQGVGDLTFHAKYRLLRALRDPIGLAAIVQLQVPTGDHTRFAGEPGAALWSMLAMDWVPHRRFRVGVNGGFRANFGSGAQFPVGGLSSPTGMTATNAGPVEGGSVIRYGHLLTFGVGASFKAADSVDLVAEMYGSQLVNGFGDRGATSMEALGGLKIFLQGNSHLMIAGGGGLPPTAGFQRADWRAVLGFIFEPAIGDADGDGIPDDIDQCPNDPEDFDGFEDEDGCPDPDNDGDGIPDELDACPNIPGVPELDGCPEETVGDRDGDGIPDDIDQCPDVPGVPEHDGCPDPDRDGDGILDEDDMCPDEPGVPEHAGCPDRGTVVIEDDELVILEKIFFKTDSAEIMSRSNPLLDAVAAALNGNPQITLMEVQGHADERGPDAYNLRLTRDRAAAVVEALVARGVQRRRLRSAGYGELCPVDPASNKDAWEKNRRVEFKIVETDDGPTGVALACKAARHLIAK